MLKIIVAASLLTMTAPAFAQTVDVKYRGAVDLGTYACTDTVSSFVNRVCFDEGQSSVVVLLRDTYYAYCYVEAGTVADWLTAESKGRFYNQNIKSNAVDGKFDCN